ncbi:hypothetical protein HMPREF0378_1607 [Eubacterium nodatum ATCC 33099]|nr:hypothetical protein HMPREF0378_1607 [Eubacterium nodatum ATCC 33099]
MAKSYYKKNLIILSEPMSKVPVAIIKACQVNIENLLFQNLSGIY